jgi:hypothetical protein
MSLPQLAHAHSRLWPLPSVTPLTAPATTTRAAHMPPWYSLQECGIRQDASTSRITLLVSLSVLFFLYAPALFPLRWMRGRSIGRVSTGRTCFGWPCRHQVGYLRILARIQPHRRLPVARVATDGSQCPYPLGHPRNPYPPCRHLASRLQHPPNAHATIAAVKPSGSLQRPLGAGSGLSARARVAPAHAAAGKRHFSSASFGNSTLSSSASSSHSCPSPRSPTPECARAGQLVRDSDLVRNRPSECGAHVWCAMRRWCSQQL